ncbi:MAG: bifunctional folylpolyglutamate synthase/dihydrofolate synthase, partial [Proteobacteria bacterium]|nr:bifunctional folylpolyglutamate synthase/dihydrofolate synthase [Pseudomonadota bacterium]
DLVILEVGLGGRLDAVNVMDADISVLTSVAIDHVDWLGDNRESIGYEKAGIFRHGCTAICGDREPPESVVSEAKNKQCEFLLAGRDFKVINSTANDWSLDTRYGAINNLPQPNLSGEFQKYNSAMAIMAMQQLQSKGLLDVQFDLSEVLISALDKIDLPGRYQRLKTQPDVFVDVAHNPQAAQALASQLSVQQVQGKTWAIVAMLADKDITGVLENVSTEIDVWCLAGLAELPRGLSVEGLFDSLSDDFFSMKKPILTEENRHDLALNQCTMLTDSVRLAETVTSACKLVLSKADANDRVIIFGSFYTVAEAMQTLSQ